ncbi:M15 family metallopeptidase [Streptobacillus moniliformis]|uniref:M15 family metallopeptidase n=1 Tax=Streptobacillus moniliformis TaxID=34105 RepID=UPI000B22508B|nr:M15 family metallopeptidase [Streptobacillus moniliformis]
MGYKFSNASYNKMENIHPKLVRLMEKVIANSPYDFKITQGVRTAEYQNKLYQQGRTIKGNIVTNCDGYIKKSNHQIKSSGYGHAIDICLYIPNETNIEKLYDVSKLTAIANVFKKFAIDRGLNVSWGGDWKSFKDYPHFELKIN